MKKITLTLLAVITVSVGCFAQQRTDEQCLRTIADNILQQPVTQFVDIQNGTIYNSTAEIPEGREVRFRTPLTEWHYANGVLNMAMINLGQYLNEPKYVDYAKNHVAFGFANYEYFKERFKNDRRHWYWPFGQLWNMKELDDCGAMGASVAEVYALTKNPVYLDYATRAAEHVMSGQIRLEDGTLCRNHPRVMTVWADDMYMGCSVLTNMGKLTGDAKYLDAAAKQVIQIGDYLWSEENGLYYHCYYTDLKRNGVAFWGRATGWIMVSVVNLLEVLPADHPSRGKLIEMLETQVVGASRYQTASGMWRQLLDKPDSYEESSVTAMYVYSIAKGVRNGWLDKGYAAIARSGWDGLKRKEITEDGRFTNVCVGTGIAENLSFYYNRPVGDNEKHGLGLVLTAGLEMMKLGK